MNELEERGESALPISSDLKIDKICRRFETAWKNGDQPNINVYLGDSPEPERSELHRELQAIKTEYLKLLKEPTLEIFTERITQCGLMTKEECDAFINCMTLKPRTADRLAKELCRKGKLTEFQMQAIYEDRSSELVIGNCVVLDELDKGGMGQVYKAQHRTMKRIVAIKVLPSSATQSPELVKRFRREVETTAKLSHPNIVTAYNADESHGIHYLEMEYIDGCDLAWLVKNHGILDVKTAVDYILQAARGLQYAHNKGVIHRDIKPRNLLLDKQNTVKVLDLGLAHIDEKVETLDATTAEGITQQYQVIGTLDYMAPEQASDTSHVDARADIYGLGCTLYYLLAGRPPYDGETALEKIMAHCQKPIPWLRALRNGVPESLDAVFRRMLAKKPEDRQQSMSEVIAQLQQCNLMATPDEDHVAEIPAAFAETKNFETYGINKSIIHLPRKKPPLAITLKIACIFAVMSVVVVGGSWFLYSGKSNKPSSAHEGQLSMPAPINLPSQMKDLQTAEVLRIAYTGQPPNASAAAEKPALQHVILARRQGESTFAPMMDGDSLASEKDDYFIVVRPLSQGYLYVFQVDSNGNKTWLYPKNESSHFSSGSNPVQSGEIVQIPSTESNQVLFLDRSTGIEHLYAVFSSTQWTDLERALANPGPTQPEVKPPNGDLMTTAIRSPNRLLNRGVGGVRVDKSLQNVAEKFVVQRKEKGQTISLPISVEPIQSSGSFMVLERWFKHVDHN
jgi:serine/threonine protein kinase